MYVLTTDDALAGTLSDAGVDAHSVSSWVLLDALVYVLGPPAILVVTAHGAGAAIARALDDSPIWAEMNIIYICSEEADSPLIPTRPRSYILRRPFAESKLLDLVHEVQSASAAFNTRGE